jgi:hypothetical protein
MGEGLSVNVRVTDLRGSLFLRGLAITDRLALAAKLNQAVGNCFDGDSAILPFPDDAPGNLPRFFLRTKTGDRACQLSLERLDLTIERRTANGSLEDLTRELISMLPALRDALVDATTRDSFWRAALISNWTVELGQPAKQFMQARYLREPNPIVDAVQIEVHALEQAPVAGCAANQWVRTRTATRANDPASEGTLTLAVDVNSSLEHQYSFSADLLGQFLGAARDTTDRLVRRHLGEDS